MTAYDNDLYLRKNDADFFYPVERVGDSPVVEQHAFIADDLATEFLTFPNLTATGAVDHYFSTRVGGYSTGECAEVNFNYRREGDREAVDKNYARAAQILGGERTIKDFVCTQQTHSTNVKQVDAAFRGRGTVLPLDYTDVDGLITNTPKLVLTVFVADCVPVYIVDPVKRAIGLVHSGWRGTVGQISAKAIRMMADAYGSDPSDLVCAVGPSICVDHYEISEDVAQAFINAFGAEALGSRGILRPSREGHYKLDLWEANRMILENAGVPRENIAVTDICTRHNPEYLFSHRAVGDHRGNCCAFLSLK